MNPEVAHALALAQKKYGRGLERAPINTHSRTVTRGHVVRPPLAFDAGRKSKRLGFARVTPYYEAVKSDHFWFAGYDGKTMQEAIDTQ